MPRPLRFLPPDSIHHVINRGNERRLLFDDQRDFGDFLELVAWAKSKCRLRIIAYCIMPNHWHFVVWPECSDAVSRFFHRLCTTHAVKRRRETETIGYGHVYQGRFKAFEIRTESYFFNAIRYIEANALRAGLVPRASLWPWSSLFERHGGHRGLIDPGPLPLPTNWANLTDVPLPQEFVADFHKKIARH